MNRTKLKSYAPQARRDFIAAVTDRAAHYGLTKGKIEPITEQGEVALLGGTPFPHSVAAKRKRLEERINRQGFEQVMEAVAYTWFNRLVAIRYMELHGYLDHSYRVLSHPEGKTIPEIIEHAEHVDLPGLDTQKVIELKLDGTKEAELYRMLLVAQCNALHSAMPFLFERINDETELLLPDNLLHSDSLIRKLVNAIDEEDWQEVEIIGWLYQFYISEKKDEVIGKVVKSEDIPAATQLFTPNWIVKYMVQNSLGRQWMETYPDSRLKEQMEYYIEPAEQTPEVQVQLKEITPDSLNPEELTLLDPACGSGHILVEAYDLLKAIYQERGYRLRDIPRLTLEKNLYGLEIDDRAAQLAAFALMMKAREDDRRIFSTGIQPNILAIQESKGLDSQEITDAINAPLEDGGTTGEVATTDISHLIDLFEHGKTIGSLIHVPESFAEKFPVISQRVCQVVTHGGLLAQNVAKTLQPIIQQASILSRKYDAVVANPPYMGTNAMNALLKDFGRHCFPKTKSDLYAMFIERLLLQTTHAGHIALMTPFTWMFISSYEQLRDFLLSSKYLVVLVQPEYHAFFDSAYVPICAFVIKNINISGKGDFIRLDDFYGEELQPVKTLEAIRNLNCGWRYQVSTQDFRKLPGAPLVYWLNNRMRDLISNSPPITEVADARQGLATADNDRFVRRWQEVDISNIRFYTTHRDEAAESHQKWFPYNKGGEFRRWWGNQEYIVNWQCDGKEIREFVDSNGKQRSRPQNVDFYFNESVSWSDITVSDNAFRYFPPGFIFDACAHSAFTIDHRQTISILAYLNTSFVGTVAKLLNPTMHFHVGYFKKLPYPSQNQNIPFVSLAEKAVQIAKEDWDFYERSWEFKSHPFLGHLEGETVEACFCNWGQHCASLLSEMKRIEEENNRLFIEAYDLQDELSPEVPEDKITLYRPNQAEDIKRLISYAIGCMMGRYSLDKPGLIYAHSGNQGFDSSQYQTFPADDDGILPITDDDWFPDDAANRVEAFIATAWPKEHLEENLKFIAESLGPNRNEQPRDTIRRYLATGFFKHHLSMYKRRPIYWLFSSGKQRAFQCLLYLHRYNEGALSRMRTEYVIPLQGKIASRIGQLDDDITAATSTSHRKRLEKERDKLLKQQVELQTFDEKLRHYADRRIRLDLDDGVKVNYAKFGDLLAEVKAVTGSTQET